MNFRLSTSLAIQNTKYQHKDTKAVSVLYFWQQ